MYIIYIYTIPERSINMDAQKIWTTIMIKLVKIKLVNSDLKI